MSLRSATESSHKSAGSDERARTQGDPHEDVARWLEELGRRRSMAGTLRDAPPNPTHSHAKTWSMGGRKIALLGVLSLSFLQYYYLGVLAEIYALPALVVFAPLQALTGA
jgi:hypothetical protein